MSTVCVFLPTWSVCEDDVALLNCSLYEGYTDVSLPVPHGLFKDGSLTTCNFKTKTVSWQDISFILNNIAFLFYHLKSILSLVYFVV